MRPTVLFRFFCRLPTPAVPDVARTTQIFGSVFAVTLIGFMLSLSLAFMFAEKGEYEIRPNQVLRCNN